MRSPSPPSYLVEYNKLLHAIAKHLYPDPVDLFPDLPGVVGKRVINRETKVWGHTTALTEEDQACLRDLVIKHAGALPPLRTVMRYRGMLVFRRAFRRIDDRPEWEPVLRTERDIEQIRHSRGDAQLLHDALLKIEIAQGRIRHFDRDRIPVAPHFERITYLPWQDAQDYLARSELDLQLLMHGPAEPTTPTAVPHDAPRQASASAADALGAEKRSYRRWSTKARDRLIELVERDQAEVAATEFNIPETYAKQQAARFKREAAIEGLRKTSRASSSPYDARDPTSSDSSPGSFSAAHANPYNESQSRGARSPALPPGKNVLRMGEVEELIGIGKSMIYEYLNPKSKYYDSTFPKRISLSGQSVSSEKKGGSGGAVGFHFSEILEWLEKRPRR